MALINCPECGKEISSYAHHCIHCGYKEKAKLSTIIMLIIASFLLIVSVFVGGIPCSTMTVLLSFTVLRNSKSKKAKILPIILIVLGIIIITMTYISVIKYLNYIDSLNVYSIIGSLYPPYIIIIIYWAILRFIKKGLIREKFKSLITPIIALFLPYFLSYVIGDSKSLANAIGSVIVVLIFSLPSVIKGNRSIK